MCRYALFSQARSHISMIFLHKIMESKDHLNLPCAILCDSYPQIVYFSYTIHGTTAIIQLVANSQLSHRSMADMPHTFAITLGTTSTKSSKPTQQRIQSTQDRHLGIVLQAWLKNTHSAPHFWQYVGYQIPHTRITFISKQAAAFFSLSFWMFLCYCTHF